MHTPVSNPHRYRGFRRIPGSSGILAPDHAMQPRPIILPEDIDDSLSGKFARAAQGILVPKGRSHVAYSQRCQFPSAQNPLSAYANVEAANAPYEYVQDHSAATRFVTETISDSEQDFRTRLAEAMQGYLNAGLKKMGQPTIEEARKTRREQGAKIAAFDGDIVMRAVRSMSCRYD